ncbi:c-type cytochrome [Hyphobacterium sp. CCMP332]|nr:c-type cytochrome [Hyphobacterium sp. CCMP332]
MKKIVKIIGLGVLFLLVVIAGFLIYVASSDIPHYEVKRIEFTAKSSPEIIARGEKLSLMLCANCHMNRETMKLTGKRMPDMPPEFGEIFSQNITQDKINGIGNWTDAELLFLLRTGIKKDGQYSPPYMPKLPTMADEDINAIIAFLRSDNHMVQADPSVDIPPRPSFLTKFLSRVAFKPFPMPEEAIEMPDTSNSIELGKYLAHNLDCFACHSADFKTNNYLDPPLSEGYFGGGNELLDLEGKTKISSNLTPDKETGIGYWSKAEFIEAVKYGRKKGQKPLQYPMVPYTQLSDKEVAAIYDYLQSLPPISNKIERAI